MTVSRLGRRLLSPDAVPPLTADARPLLASVVAFHETADDGVWIASVQGVPSSRVSRAVVDLLTAMDGATALGVLHERFAASEPFDDFLQLVERFRDNGLLDGSAVRPPGRVTYRPPFTVQLATLRAAALFARLDRVLLSVPQRAMTVSLAVLLCAGALAATTQAADLWRVVTEPIPLLGLVTLLAVLPLATLLHESAHGLTLTRFGGRPRRAGVMLFYLTPAFFVDVTDGWRLPSRRQRVAVALAGPAVHAAVAALAFCVALAAPRSAVRDTLLLLGLACAVVVLVNLIPFVRFDGYIALMSALDEPNLRARTIRDGAGFLASLLFGARRSSRTVDAWWSVPFGLASILTPIVLVCVAVARVAQALAGGGPVLGLVVVALEAFVVVAGGAVLFRALRGVFDDGVRRIRFFVVTIVLAALVAAAGAVVPVRATASLGFVSDGHTVVLVQHTDDAVTPIAAGAAVVLTTRSIVASERIAEGTATPHRVQSTTVPLEALLPVRSEALSVPAVIVATVDVTDGAERLPATGQARIDLGTTTLWQQLWQLAVVSPLSPFLGEHKEG